MAHAVKGGDGEEEEDVDAAAALPHAVAHVEAPSVYCFDSERSVSCCCGAVESKGGSEPPARQAERSGKRDSGGSSPTYQALRCPR